MYTSISNLFALGLLASAPLASAIAIPNSQQLAGRDFESSPISWARALIEDRHHTEKQIAAKQAKAAKATRDVEVRHHTEKQIAAKAAKAAKANNKRDIGISDEEALEDLEDAQDIQDAAAEAALEDRSPHHTEKQIAAKQAKAAKANTRDVGISDEEALEDLEYAEDLQDAAAEAALETREPHHTEKQIAAKAAKAAKANRDVEEREPHHTEKQIAAKAAKAAKGN